jgi:hypothetical protein
MRMRIWLSVYLLTCLTLVSAQVKTDPSSEIGVTRQQSNHALATRDIKIFGESLAPEFVMVRGNGEFVPSRQAYIDLLVNAFNDPNAVRYERLADKIEISSAAPIAAEHGHWTGTLPNGKRVYSGTYLAMWRRSETGWKIRSELFIVLNCEDQAACAGYRK